MSQTSSALIYRQQIAELVALAVPETDPERRRQLLEEADHWGRLLRSQRQRRSPAERRSFAPEDPRPTAAGGFGWAAAFTRRRPSR